MGSIGFFMFHVIGISVLVMIAVLIAATALPRRSRRAPVRRQGRTDGREMHPTGRR